MTDSIYRVTEVIGTSTTSWEDATKNAVETAAHTLRDLRVGEENPLAESMGDDADLQDLGDPHMPGLERDSDDALTLPDDEGED